MMIGALNLLPYEIALALLVKLPSAMWKEKTTNQRGSSLQQINSRRALQCHVIYEIVPAS